jgi:hypothetical protein
MPASKRASPITSAARGLGSEGWWDTHFRAQVAPRRRASQAYLAELLKTSDAPRGESESLKECTFKPKLRKKKKGGGASKAADPADDGASAADVRIRKLGEFLERVEQTEAERTRKITMATGTKAFDARVDRLKCPQCGRFQAYKEHIDGKKKCSNCAVRFKPALGEWFAIEESFYGKLEREEELLAKKKAALTAAATRVARNGAATFVKGARVRVKVAKWKRVDNSRRANSGWRKGSSATQRSAEKASRRKRRGGEASKAGEEEVTAEEEEGNAAPAMEQAGYGAKGKQGGRRRAPKAPLFANFELGTVKFVNGDGSLDIEYDEEAMRAPYPRASRGEYAMRTTELRVARSKCALVASDPAAAAPPAKPWQSVKKGFLNRTAASETAKRERFASAALGATDSECTFKPRLASARGAVDKSLQAHPELTREGRRDVVAAERAGTRAKAVEKWKVFSDTWGRVPLIKRNEAMERQRNSERIDLDGEDDEGAVTREGVEGALTEIEHQTMRMERLLRRFAADRHLRGDKQRARASSKEAFTKAQRTARVDFGKAGAPNAALLQTELKACLAANADVIDRAWAAKDEDALRAAVKTSKKLSARLVKAEKQTHTASFNPLVQQRYTIVAPDGCQIYKTSSLSSAVVGACHSGDVVRTDAAANAAWSGGVIHMVHLADDRGWIAMTDGDTGEELVEKVRERARACAERVREGERERGGGSLSSALVPTAPPTRAYRPPPLSV